MAETLDMAQLEKALKDLPIPRIHFFAETDSTNEQGLKIAAPDTPEFTLLIAERQTAGRGRLGHRWVSAPGTSLTFSLILQPRQTEIAHLGLFSLLGGLVVCRAMETYAQVQAQVKWPNDVLLDGKKAVGILGEANWQGQTPAGLVLGIGINLLPGSIPPADTLRFPATCLQAHTPREIERLPFLHEVLAHLIRLRPQINTPAFLDEYEQRMAYMGQR
jgi:BirA family biotin operon repressor/biotin-[acetyl-CoA-carboxylase] ligase